MVAEISNAQKKRVREYARNWEYLNDNLVDGDTYCICGHQKRYHKLGEGDCYLFQKGECSCEKFSTQQKCICCGTLFERAVMNTHPEYLQYCKLCRAHLQKLQDDNKKLKAQIKKLKASTINTIRTIESDKERSISMKARWEEQKRKGPQ